MKKMCSIAIMALLCVFFASPTFAVGLTFARAQGEINVRATPSLDGKLVKSLSAEGAWILLVDRVPVFNSKDGRNWYRVYYYYRGGGDGEMLEDLREADGIWYVSERVIALFSTWG